MVLCLWMYICIFVAVRFEFKFYIYIYICIYIWSDLNLNYFFFAWKSTVGAVLDWTALTNTHSRGGWWYSRPYRSPLQGRLILPAAPTEVTVGVAENTSRPYRGTAGAAENTNRPYRGTLCRNTLGRAAGATTPTEALEPPLQLNSVVVIFALRFKVHGW